MLLVVAARHTLAQVGSRVHLLAPGALAVSTALTAAGTGATVLPYRAVLAELGSPLPLGAVVRVFFLGQLGKYLPGSVWPVLAQMELGRGQGVPRPRAGAAAAVSLVLSVVVALLVAVVALPWGHPGALDRYGWVFLALPVGLLALSPPVLARLLAAALRLLRRPPLERPLGLAAIGRAAAGSALAWVLQGAGVWVLARDLGARGATAAPLAVASFALAWVAGFLVLVAPAGAAVREVALTALLLPVLPQAAGLLVALVARLEFTVADLLWGGAAVLAGQAARRRARAGGTPPGTPGSGTPPGTPGSGTPPGTPGSGTPADSRAPRAPRGRCDG